MAKLKIDKIQLIKLRHALGLSQSDMAEICQKKRLNIALSTIKRAESGKPVSLRTIRNIAMFHQCPIEQLIENETSRDSLSSSSEDASLGAKPATLCGFDHEIEQFDTSVRRSQKLVTSHLVYVKSDIIQKADTLMSFFILHSKHCKFETLEIDIDPTRYKEQSLPFNPFKKLESCLQEIRLNPTNNQPPHIVFIKHFDLAKRVFISQFIQFIDTMVNLPLVIVVSAKVLSSNLLLLQNKLNDVLPKITIELAHQETDQSTVTLN